MQSRIFLASLAIGFTVPSASVAQAFPFGREAIDAFVGGARTRTLGALDAKSLELPADFLAWVDADPVRRASVYGCRKDPLPVLLGLRSLEIDLGEDVVRRDYPQLAIAFALQRSYLVPGEAASGWNDGAGAKPEGALPDVSPRPRLQLSISGDPRIPVDTKDRERELDRNDHIINFLEDHPSIEVEITVKEPAPLEYDAKGVAKPRGKPVKVKRKISRPLVGADVIASAELQVEFNAYMKERGHGDIVLDCGERVVHWNSKAAVKDREQRKRIKAAHELFHTAYRNKGRMPAERDRAPTAAESMAWWIRNDRDEFTPAGTKKKRTWPMFPLNAPWPVLLMLVADDQPLREREDIWTKFRTNGEFRTYGEYIGGIAQQFDMQSARRVSPIAFNYGSIQMMWKDGGVCGTMGNIGARTYRICGVPSSTAGQPGHCAIVRMKHDSKSGDYTCVGGQYATGGDEVTTVHAGWNYDDVGGRRPMVFHQSVAWGVNHGLFTFIDGLVLRRMWDAADDEFRSEHGVAFTTTAVHTNPFALAAIVGAIDTAANAEAVIAILDAFEAEFERFARLGQYPLYRTTVRELAHARILKLPAPKTKLAAERLLVELERQGCSSPRLLARTWRAIGGESEFTDRCVRAAETYVALPGRTTHRGVSKAFAKSVKAWQRTVKGKKKKRAWAEAMLAEFDGKETIKIRRKKFVDPAVAELCRLAGRDVPSVK